MSHFIVTDRKTDYLLPPSLDDWLNQDHLARFIVEVVDQLDLSKLTRQYAGRGSKAYHPATLLAILVYGYATGIFSSRRLERATYDSVAFRYIAAGSHPDHDSLATFRRRFLDELSDLFLQVLAMAKEMKLLKLGNVCLDGTKIDANASRHSALSHGHIEKLEAQLKAEVQELFRLAEQADQADVPDERWFWFDPPFHPNQSVLLHKQADNVWRIDFQLGWDADPETEKKPENVIPRIKAMLGDEREFELEWVSIYTFQCRRMNSFNHGRVLFVGDAAHQVSPFGARGANSGIQDTDNLAWKLKLVIDGKAPPTLLDTYTEERGYAADENIMNSTRSTDFITPKSNTSKTFRNAVLELAAKYPFARALVNSGRLSVPSWLARSSLNTPDSEAFDGDMIPGAPMADAPVQAGSGSGDGWLLRQLGNRFQALHYVEDASALDAQAARTLGELAYDGIAVEPIVIAQRGQAPAGLKTLLDSKGRLSQRYDLKPGTTYLARPDQHVAARWRALDAAKVKAAVARATGNA